MTVDDAFPTINRAFGAVFQSGQLSLGLVVPIEAYQMNPVPTMAAHIERARLAEELGFAALWLRDVPFNVPTFGDAGQMFDPFVYLGYLAAHTHRIALATGSIILPLRHPAHVAKAAATADQLSGGRLLLGVASGDRPEEYPAMDINFPDRGERFREAFTYIREMAEPFPAFQNAFGSPQNMDMLPKPTGARLPLLVTGGSQQDPDWIAEHSDGWITYPRGTGPQSQIINDYRARIAAKSLPNKPVSQSLYIDLTDNADDVPSPIHLGFRSGTRYLLEYLTGLRDIGVNHVALNLRFNTISIETTLKRLADDVMPALAS